MCSRRLSRLRATRATRASPALHSARVALVSLVSLAVLAAVAGAAHARTPVLDPESFADATEGLDHLYHGRETQAAVAFERIRTRYPKNPAGDFLLGGIEWHRMVTGPTGSNDGPARRAFHERMDATIRLGEQAIDADEDDLAARFFLGGAYGYRARDLALDEKWWDAYRTGKKGVEHLEHVVEKDSDFADAYLGLGIYHYYSDVLPSVLKLFAGLVGVHGDRERGLAEIGRALEHGQLVPVECRFFLAEIHVDLENDAWTALGYSRSLRDDYPENELFTWMNARVLEELHEGRAAAEEWSWLLERPRRDSHRGFLLYRIGRSKLYGGDFEGAAQDLTSHLAADRLGSKRMTAWGHVRLGQALDFLGHHERALEHYRLAKDTDGGGSVEERAKERLSAGRRDPSVLSIREIGDIARILANTRHHGESDLRRVETMLTASNRGLDAEKTRRYFAALRDLAQARLHRGDVDGCLAAVERALDGDRSPPKESRALLLELRAVANLRRGERERAIRDLDDARARAPYGDRDRLDARRALLRSWVAHMRPPSAEPAGAVPIQFAMDAGAEIVVHVEGDFLPNGSRLPMRLDEGTWRATWRVPAGTTVRYRFVIDAETRRVDAHAPLVRWEPDGPWCYRPVPAP